MYVCGYYNGDDDDDDDDDDNDDDDGDDDDDGCVFAAMNSVPRVLFDGWSDEDYTALFSSENEQDLCSRTLIQFLQVCIRAHTKTYLVFT